MSENDKTKLTNEELLGQMLDIFLAGHETTAVTLSFVLLELSRHPEFQQRLRQEIHAKERREGKLSETFGPEDYEDLPYLHAVVKEGLRVHPVVVHIFKEAEVDDCIPLSQPILTKAGNYIDTIPVAKGQRVHISVNGHNRFVM
ncbi:hypothetical protein V5O48_004484 [Marasmius crinis-equi]|uniref:Cytochrome P450 n=1 Tax=Marasmius crinis-equi TaxID=585013 RepID=A0ABR3FQ56_9AGAR